VKFVYVASPYTIGDVAMNVRRNIEAADQLATAGFASFVPLLSHLWHLIIPHSYEFWIAHGLAWLERCDAVVRLPGESSGADAEVARALELGLPVYFSVKQCIEAQSVK